MHGPPGGASICAGKPDSDWWRLGFPYDYSSRWYPDSSDNTKREL